MTQNPPRDVPASLPPGNRLMLWVAIFCFVFAAPQLVIDHLLENVTRSLMTERETRAANAANALMARIEENLDPVNIATVLLKRFERLTNRWQKRGSRPADFGPAEAARYAKLFRRVPFFHARSVLLWFDAQGRLVLPEGEPRPSFFSSWPSLVKVLAPGAETTGPDVARAQRLIAATMGELATIPYLRGAWTKPRELYFEQRRHILGFFRIYHPRRREVVLATAMAFIPTDPLPRDWNLQFAVRELAGANAVIGGIRQSSERGFGQGLLGPNVLRGLALSWQGGSQDQFYREHFLHVRPWSKDQDLLLVAAIRQEDDESLLQWVKTGKFLLWLLVAVAGGSCLAAGLGMTGISLSLHAKFILGSAFLVLAPLSFLFLLGVDHMTLFRQMESVRRNQELDCTLQGIEQDVISRMTAMEKSMKSFLTDRVTRLRPGKEYIRRQLGAMKPLGLKKFLLLAGPKTTLMAGLDLSADSKQANLFLLGLIRQLLDQLKFPVPPDVFPKDIPAEAQWFTESIIRTGLVNSLLNHFYVLDAGTNKWNMFLSTGRNSRQQLKTFLALIFDYSLQRNALLRISRRQAQSPQRLVFLPGIDAGLPRSLFPLAQRAEKTQQDIFSPITYNGQSWMALARYQKRLEAVTLAALPLQDSRHILTRIRRLLFLLFLLSGGAGVVIGGLMRRLLLAPASDLADAAAGIEAGKLGWKLKVWSQDELGLLAENFNHLLEGLREKARMTPFLRRELLVQSRQSLVPKTERTRMTVLFAGIRNFRTLETILPLEDVLAVMNHFLSLCEQAVRANGGEIDKFIGDTAMALFRDGDRLLSAQKAAKAAAELESKVEEWLAERKQKDRLLFSFGVGIATGQVVAGSIGSQRKRLDFTVIGDTVNLAARLEKLAGSPGFARILGVGEVADQEIPGRCWHPVQENQIRGKAEEVRIMELRHE